MNLPMYENARKLRDNPYDYYVNHLQALINSQWENSTQTYLNIEQETGIGTKAFEPVDISVDTAIDIGTGFKKGDDFKVFSHRDISHEVPLGTMFKTERDYWICINTNGFASPTNSCEVRRCNNMLKWVDPHTGYLHQQWCAIDYELSSPQPAKDKDIVVARGHLFIMVQGNEETWGIEKNQRFIFNGQPYTMLAVQSMLEDSAEERVDTLLYMDLYLDTTNPSDNLVDNIANATDYVYELNINPDVLEQVPNFTGQMEASVMLNGEPVERDLVWNGNSHVIVEQDGSYTLIGKVGEIATINVGIKGNPDLIASCNVEIVDAVQDNFDIVITPLFDEVRQKIPQSFTVYLYKNGIRQDDDINWGYDGLTDDYFTLLQDGHNFTLSVDKISNHPLILTFSSADATRTINVMLKPLF